METASIAPAAKNKVVKKAPTKKNIRVLITGPVAWLGFPWNINQEVTVPANQAQEMIDQKVAKKL